MVQTIYDIVKAHGGEIKVKQKKVKEVSLLFNYQLFESRINGIKRLHRFKKCQEN